MPRAKSSKPKPKAKPYSRSTSSPPSCSSTDADSPSVKSEPEIEAKTESEPGPESAKMKRGAWTGDEYVAVFDCVARKAIGPSAFAGAVHGRTGKQAYLCWRQVVQGVCRRALLDKAKGGK